MGLYDCSIGERIRLSRFRTGRLHISREIVYKASMNFAVLVIYVTLARLVCSAGLAF
jgi:hypothetical protein